MTARQPINLAPRPSALIESLRSIGYTLETALADIVDNSITANAARVSILFRWNSGDPWIAIVDNGNGMSAAELTAAMRFGSASPLDRRDENDLGRFGLGMKTASISQCRRLSVASRKGTSISAREWNLETIAAEDSDEWNLGQLDEGDILDDHFLASLITTTLGKLGPGTIVLWRLLDLTLIGEGTRDDESRFDELLDSARKHLETVFHRFLSPDSGFSAIRMDFNGSELEASNPFGPTVFARQELPLEEIRLGGGVVRVQPFVLPHHSKVGTSEYLKYAGEEGYLHNQGFYIYRQRRLIVKATWFRLIRKEELNKLIRVRVDIPNSLDHLWSINVNKSQVRPPESVRRELKKVIGRIESAGKLVYRRRATRLLNRALIPVWRREVSEGKIRYRVNQEHPLLKHLLEISPEDISRQLQSGISLIEQSFPYDACYADVANDAGEIDRPAFDSNVCEQVLAALRACGFEGDELRERLLKTEIPGATDELIDKILKPEDNA